ncbi:MAG: hypothetical protein ABW166_21420 [Sedimenticola sp.]
MGLGVAGVVHPLPGFRKLNPGYAYLKLVHRWQWLSHGQYRHVSEMVAEIGRLLGGWLRLLEACP